uniref:Uncharacterized protein n=1 Tax=Physcomitrium patens TaxID=3218 RepID=A0A2K1J1C6_PHYPA|nr:hypothetical protein PHYPA_023228 [Physcomitrium patens]
MHSHLLLLEFLLTQWRQNISFYALNHQLKSKLFASNQGSELQKTTDLRDPTDHNQQAQLPLIMNQELDTTLISSREACTVEATECKQEDLEEDTCKYPLDYSSSEDVGSRGHEDGTLLQQQDSKSLVSVAAANVATCWLELLSLDVKGRLAALTNN